MHDFIFNWGLTSQEVFELECHSYRDQLAHFTFEIHIDKMVSLITSILLS